MLHVSHFFQLFFIVYSFVFNAYASVQYDKKIDSVRLAKNYIPGKEETLTDQASIDLANSNPLFCNVGQLTVFSGQKVAGRGSVEYLGGLTAVTAAHCVLTEGSVLEKKFVLSFTLIDGRVETRDVETIEVHPNYKADMSYDVAVLKLKTSIDGLNGLSPCYEYGKEERKLSEFPNVTFVGYCGAYSDVEYRSFADGKRRACKSRLFLDRGTEKIGLISMHYRANRQQEKYIVLNYFPYEREVTVPRLPMEYELRPKAGMSGGAVFEQNEAGNMNLIAVSALTIDDYISTYHLLLYKSIIFLDSFLDCFRGYCAIPHLKQPKDIYEGQIAVSVPLGAVEEWLEGWRREFDEIKDGNISVMPKIMPMPVKQEVEPFRIQSFLWDVCQNIVKRDTNTILAVVMTSLAVHGFVRLFI